jgi:hypothetical protein
VWKWIAAILLLLAGTAITWWVHTPRGPSGQIARPAVLVVSGDTDGWITPCGCTSNQSGGLLRRGTYLQDMGRRAQVIYADVGGAPAGTSAYERVKFEAVLTGEMAMNLAAHNIGGPEARLGPAYLRDIARRMHCPLVSANARDASGLMLAPPFCIVPVSGRRVALIGVLSPSFANSEIIVGDPKQAVLDAMNAASGRFDLAIVLAYLPEGELAQLAAALPELEAVIGGPTGQAIAPQQRGANVIAAATNKGKFLVQLELPAAPGRRVTGSVVELTAAYADQEPQLANLRQFLTTLAASDFPAAQTGFARASVTGAPADYRVAGNDTCRRCHLAETGSWEATSHAHALATLKPRGFEVDAFCLQCHTTGYGLPGGFDSPHRSLERTFNVGCESCHGPSQAHVDNQHVRTPYVAADQCVRCHDHENSPGFDFTASWQRIRHGALKGGPA